MAIDGLIVSDDHGLNPIKLPRTFTRVDIPFGDGSSMPSPEDIRRFDVLAPIVDHLPVCDGPVEILIGANCPAALEPMYVVSDLNSCPLIAIQLRHGWTLMGSPSHSSTVTNFRISIQEKHAELKQLPTPMGSVCDSEFGDSISHDTLALSRQDKKFIVKEGMDFVDGHHVIPLPFKCDATALPDNRSVAERRLNWQKQKMLRDQSYYADYKKFIDKLLEKGYCEVAPSSRIAPGRLWCLPHHGVYNINKPGKIRVVFDCSSRFNGVSLNDHLIQGPDLMQSLFDVLTRFREHPTAFVADLEAMFHQVRVPPTDRSFLRFFFCGL